MSFNQDLFTDDEQRFCDEMFSRFYNISDFDEESDTDVSDLTPEYYYDQEEIEFDDQAFENAKFLTDEFKKIRMDDYLKCIGKTSYSIPKRRKITFGDRSESMCPICCDKTSKWKCNNYYCTGQFCHLCFINSNYVSGRCSFCRIQIDENRRRISFSDYSHLIEPFRNLSRGNDNIAQKMAIMDHKLKQKIKRKIEKPQKIINMKKIKNYNRKV